MTLDTPSQEAGSAGEQHSETVERGRPDIYDYLDYRPYVRDLYEHLKQVRRRFSLRSVVIPKAGKGGAYSVPFLHKVLAGDKPMPEAMIPGFAAAFGLNEREAQFLERLVRYTLADSTEAKREAFARLAWRAEFRERHRVGSRQRLDFITDGTIGDLYLMTALPDFVADATEISRRLLTPVSQQEVAHALEVLTALGLIEVDGDGSVRRLEAPRPEPDEGEPVLFQLYHQEQCDKAKTALERIDPAQRRFTTWGLSRFTPENFACLTRDLEARMQEALIELVEHYESRPGDPGEVVAQVNLQLFPVNLPETDKGGDS